MSAKIQDRSTRSAAGNPYTAILRDKRRSGGGSSVAEWVTLIQGLYYSIGGLWPLVAMWSFTAVTGPKTDLWLVRVVAALVLVIGIVFLIGALRQVLSLEIGLLMLGASLALAVIDFYYVSRGVLLPVYLADAAEETLVFVLSLAFIGQFRHRRHSSFI
jgi:hypothetical protein